MMSRDLSGEKAKLCAFPSSLKRHSNLLKLPSPRRNAAARFSAGPPEPAEMRVDDTLRSQTGTGSLFIVPLGIARFGIAHGFTLPDCVSKRAKLPRFAVVPSEPVTEENPPPAKIVPL